jgi:hypothetical protein
MEWSNAAARMPLSTKEGGKSQGPCLEFLAEGRRLMFIAIAIILAVIWLILFLALHITAFAVHILIILAVIALIVHFFTGRRRV